MQKTIKKILTLICISLFLLCGQNIYAQQREIKGTVTDTQGEPLIGVTIAVKGTNKATMTDVDGAYILSVGNEAKTLVATFVGMKPGEKNITGSIMDFVLEDLSSELEEVVVIGYGTVKRKDLTGAVSSIKGDAIQAIPVSNVAEAITGKLAGVQITTTEGSPDAEVKIRVRGGGSITGDNTPLYIIDGFPVQSINDIASSDIASIDILKDASSTAIYGSRGANGVILITTKSGKEGKISVNYDAFYSWKKIGKTLDALSPKDYALWQYELARLRGDESKYTKLFGAYQDMDLYDNITFNDWQDLTFGSVGHTFNHSLSLRGGSDKLSFNFNYTHINDKAIMAGSSFKRDNLSLKLNSKPTKNVSLDFSVRYADTDTNGGGTNDAKSTLDTDKRLGYSVIYTPVPLLSNLTSDSGSGDDDLGNLYHPLAAISDNARKQERKTLNLAGSFGWEIFDNFRVKAEIGLDDYRNSDNKFWGLTTYYAKNDGSGNPITRLVNIDRNTLRNTNTINYNFKKLIGKDHYLNVMAGQEYIGAKIKTLTVEHRNFPKEFTADQAWNLSSQGDNITKAEDFYNPDDKLLSFFGRANYDWQSKYILNFTFRADGSSKFGKGHRWGYFPSAAAAWRVSSESFMAGSKSWLEDMKLRLSYGTAGNNNIPSGVMIQTFSAITSQWINGFKNYWAPTTDDGNVVMANPDLKWETTITRNIGLDFSILGGKVNGTIDAYLNTTKDLLMQFPVSGGYTVQYRNMGENRNKGIEATVNWIALDKKDYSLSVSANIGFNKNTIMSLGIMDDFGYISRWASSEINEDFWIAVGGSVGKMYGYRSDGRYEVSDFEEYDGKTWKLKDGVTNSSSAVGTLRPGSMKLKDLTGDDNNVTSEDCEIIGDANPLHTGGFTINGRLYGFDVSANFNWSYGNDIYNANKIEYTQTSKYDYRNMSSIMESGKRWTNLRPDGTISNDAAELAAMNANTTMWSPYTQKRIFSDWAVEDGSFLRLNTLTLGYTLPKTIVSKAGIQNVRFYVTGYNLLCITGYSGFDPEVSTIRKTNLSPGVDYSAYPKSRQFIIGLNLNF